MESALTEVNTSSTLICLFTSLAVISVYAVIVSRKDLFIKSDEFISARNTQTGVALGWSFFASGMGSWVLFSFPQIGVASGSWGVIGYTLSMMVPLIILAYYGPKLRSMMPDGVTWSDYIRSRYGPLLHIWVFFVAMLYQFIAICGELTGVADFIAQVSPSTHRLYPIIAVSVFTTLYTAFGGLKSSIATDVWQGVGVVGLVVLVCVAMFIKIEIPDGAWAETNVAAFTTMGFEVLVTLILAVTSAAFFFTGFWQRVWAAKNDRELKLGCFCASAVTIPFTVFLAMTGMIYVAAGNDAAPVIAYEINPFFAILQTMSNVWSILVIVIVTFLVASSADTIQNGMAAEITSMTSHLFQQGISTGAARFISALINIPAIIVASIGYYDVLTLFLIADLFAAVTVGPMMLGLWSGSRTVPAICGCFGGILAVIIQGIIKTDGSIAGGFKQLMLYDGLSETSTMISFILAVTVPVIITILGSLAFPLKEIPMMQVVEEYEAVDSPAAKPAHPVTLI